MANSVDPVEMLRYTIPDACLSEYIQYEKCGNRADNYQACCFSFESLCTAFVACQIKSEFNMSIKIIAA